MTMTTMMTTSTRGNHGNTIKQELLDNKEPGWKIFLLHFKVKTVVSQDLFNKSKLDKKNNDRLSTSTEEKRESSERMIE